VPTETPDPREATYRRWEQLVNKYLITFTGLGIDDIPDQNYRKMFNDRIEPDTAASRIVRRLKSGTY